MNEESFKIWFNNVIDCNRFDNKTVELEIERLAGLASAMNSMQVNNVKEETNDSISIQTSEEINDIDDSISIQTTEETNDETTAKKNKKKLRRLASVVRNNIFIPSVKKRKKLQSYDIFLYLGHFIKWLNPKILLSVDFLTDENRQNIKYAYKHFVCNEIKIFVMEMIYPYSNFNDRGDKLLKKSFKKSEINMRINQFMNENYEILFNYFNSDLFNQYINMLNLHVSALFAFIFKAPTDNVVSKIRSFYIETYL